jgi:acetyltransferase-like isoleucine patch superfamily enzyme
MTSLIARVRRGEGPFWAGAKNAARLTLQFHLPVNGATRSAFGLLYGAHVSGREGLAWALRFFWYEPLFRSRCSRVGERFRMERLPYMSGNGRIDIGGRVQLSGKPSVEFSNVHRPDPELRIGDGTFVGHACAFHVAESVRVGRDCLLAGGVAVYDTDGHPLDAGRRRAGEPVPRSGVGPVTIGDGAWIGAGALILKGVTIGDRAVVAARSVVTRDVPADTLVAGNPARPIRALAPVNPQAEEQLHVASPVFR